MREKQVFEAQPEGRRQESQGRIGTVYRRDRKR